MFFANRETAFSDMTENAGIVCECSTSTLSELDLVCCDPFHNSVHL